jgi:hypothetical protein
MQLSSASPVLNNISIKGNKSITYGGGIYVSIGSPQLTNVSITDNDISGASGGGGGMYVTGGAPVLTNVVIKDNIFVTTGSSGASGGGMYLTVGSPVLTNVIIAGNQATGGSGVCNGGGIYFANSSPVLTNVAIKGNTLTGNSGVSGGGMAINTGSGATPAYKVVLTNVALTGNVLSGGGTSNVTGGGLCLTGTNSHADTATTMTNCTIAGNWSSSSSSGTSGGGGIYALSVPAGKITIRNSIVWGNTVGAGDAAKNEWVTTNAQVFQYSVVKGMTATGNNIDSSVVTALSGHPFVTTNYAANNDPKTDGDYQLNPAAGAGLAFIDAGWSYFAAGLDPDLSGVTKDLAGNDRRKGIGLMPDLGAWEKQP